MFNETSMVTFIVAVLASAVAVQILIARSPARPHDVSALRAVTDQVVAVALTACAVTINAPTAGWRLYGQVHQHASFSIAPYVGVLELPVAAAVAAGALARQRGYRPLAVWRNAALAGLVAGGCIMVASVVVPMLIRLVFSGWEF